ncbi:helicase-exonuclease AddAB subunit AddA [Vagococcus bubulae]|uniref:helicase-exonuclease AddAB subunit AddA n=1 Tax=Vagococcus bubulae TaxID=1977868 RepID=UPI0022E0610A|nr:helicase-exonuclease AddAB subunit AddA [Vagococcus bubulae]
MSNIDIPVKPENSHFTDKQWQAVYDSGDNLLISASAGSGKTTVLVERVIQKIKSGVNVDELLIVTYTEAAAKEMKQRIKVAIQTAITEEVDTKQKEHLVKQLGLLPTATISTLHAFCLRVIQRYYYLIHIDPVFRLLTDETENLLLKEDVWDELREELYGEEREAFYQLTENFSNDRNDNGLMELIFSIHLFAQANSEPENWLDSLLKNYQITDSLVNSSLYQQYMKPDVLNQLLLAQATTDELVNRCQSDEELKKTLETVSDDKQLIDTLLFLITEDRLDDFYDYLISTPFTRIKAPSKKTASEEVQEEYQEIKLVRDGVKESIGKLRSQYFKQSPKEMLEILEKSQSVVEELISVTKRFISRFSKEKESRHVLDFNDLEHLTLAILRKMDNDQWVESEASTYYRHKFNEILVDEYQDINRLQETILYWLRRPEKHNGNLFMVGDVKQSIYGFRLADPTLFIEKYEQFATEEDGRRIILAENFRSRSHVLDFTNLVFTQLMDKELGQLDYDTSAELIVGNKSFPESKDYDTELLIYQTTSEEKEQESLEFRLDGKTEGELRLVALKIRDLIDNKFELFDKKEKVTRQITYKDIVLLTPTKKNNLDILDIFKEYDIPLMVNDTQNYFQATEIRIMISLLQLIDNPYQDIPLAAILRSPIVGIGENDMVLLKSYDMTGYYYDALQKFLIDGDKSSQLYQIIETFNQQFNHWRELARRKRLVELIWQIYKDTDLLDYVAGLPSGMQRKANLHALYHRASSYEEMSFKGLFQFIRFIEKMQQKNKDLAEASNINEEADAVRVMTIHASKGLEFPVVFLLDMSKQFNLMDVRQRKFVFDEELGMGIKYKDIEKRLEYDTFPFSVIREHKKQKLLAEEMRKLYVALTRAEEKLYLVGSYKDKEDAYKKWATSTSTEHVVLPTASRQSTSSLMDWVGMTLVRHPAFETYFPTSEVTVLPALKKHPGQFSIHFYQEDDILDGYKAQDEQEKDLKPSDMKPNVKLLKEVVDRLDFSYPEKDATMTTSYQSVSEVKRLFEDPDMKDLPTLDFSKERQIKAHREVARDIVKPRFMEGDVQISSTDIGSAVHLLMQLLPLNKKPTEQDIKNQVEDLIANDVFTEALASKLPINRIESFFDTTFGEYLIAHHEVTRREQPFSLLLPAKELYQDYVTKKEDTVLIHGIIDGFVLTDTEFILYDFKTDYVPNHATVEDLEKLKQRYVGQLTLYQLALEEIYQRDVTSSKLILLNSGDVIDMI